MTRLDVATGDELDGSVGFGPARVVTGDSVVDRPGAA